MSGGATEDGFVCPFMPEPESSFCSIVVQCISDARGPRTSPFLNTAGLHKVDRRYQPAFLCCGVDNCIVGKRLKEAWELMQKQQKPCKGGKKDDGETS